MKRFAVLLASLLALVGVAAPSALARTHRQPVKSAGGDPTLLGNEVLESTVDEAPVGVGEAGSFVASTSGTVESAHFYVSSGTKSTSFSVGVYTNSGSNPGTLIASGTISKPTVGAWDTITLSHTAVVKGTTYWVAYANLAGGVLKYRDVGNSGSKSENESSSSLKSLPATWVAGATWKSDPMSVYVGGSEAKTETEAERLEREQHEREAKEKAEREAREKAEREAKEKVEREAREKAEREQREREAREHEEEPKEEPPVEEPPVEERAACAKTTSSLATAESDVSSGGVTCLTSGSYGKLALTNAKPSSATLEPAPGATVTLAGGNLRNDSHVTVEGFRLTEGFEVVEGGTYLTFAHNDEPSGECGVELFAYSGGVVEHDSVIDNTFEDLNFHGSEDLCSGVGVVAVSEDAEPNYITINGNTFGPKIADHYTQFGGVNNLVEDGNRFLGPSLRAEHGEEDHQNVLQDFGGGTNLQFDNNRVENAGANGGTILLQGEGEKHNVEIVNNLFTEDIGFSIQIYPTDGLTFTHNTFIHSQWGVLLRKAESSDNTHGEAYNVSYNIFANTWANGGLTDEGCSSSCAQNHNVSTDGSASGEGSIDNWTADFNGEDVPLGLPFEAGYRP